MASDSWDEGPVSVELPAELDEWLEQRAATLGVDRDAVIVQLLSSYRAARSLDGDLAAEEVFEDVGESLDVEAVVADVLEERGEELIAGHVAAAVERELAERLSDEVEAAVEEHLPTITDAVEGRMGERIDRIDGEFQEKLVDVRERVIQVKKETDAKAPADHGHEALGRIDDLAERVEALGEQLDAAVEELENDLEAVRADTDSVEADQGEIEERLTDTEEKLQRVAWVVSDLKEKASGRTAQEEAVAEIKRAAAAEDVRTAACERCGESVDLTLLTDPECPHCGVTVADVAMTGWLLNRTPKLVTASELESGEE